MPRMPQSAFAPGLAQTPSFMFLRGAATAAGHSALISVGNCSGAVINFATTSGCFNELGCITNGSGDV